MPLVLLPALLAGCGDPDASDAADTDTPVVDDTDGPQAGVAPHCSETYTVPAVGGTVIEDAVDPHQDVFGQAQTVDDAGEVSPDPKHVHLGWPSSDTSRSVSFLWSTDTGTLSSVVELAVGADLSGEVVRYEGVSFGYGGDDGDADQPYRVHELKLCGRLEPSTTYSYRVGGEGHWSDVHTFTTPGEPGSFDSFVAVFSGDSRGSYEQWGTLVQRMAAENPDLYLFSGDMVEFGFEQGEWYAWWEATGDVFAEAFMVPAHGNHEYLATNYFSQFSLPGNEQWYSIDYGSASFAVLIDLLMPSEAIEVDQVAFIDEALGGSSADWKLAMHHATTYSISDKHGSNTRLREAWGPAFDRTGTDVVLAGHNHIYERSKPIRAGAEAEPGEGTVYLVSGGAGAPLYEGVLTDEEDTWFNAKALAVEHYIVAEFGPDQLVLTAKDLSGNVIDTVTLPKR